MATSLEDYADKLETIRFRREDGILEMTLYTNGDSLHWGPVVRASQVGGCAACGCALESALQFGTRA